MCVDISHYIRLCLVYRYGSGKENGDGSFRGELLTRLRRDLIDLKDSGPKGIRMYHVFFLSGLVSVQLVILRYGMVWIKGVDHIP